jgi:hypothetical protein
MDMQHEHGHVASKWTCSIDMDIQQWNGHGHRQMYRWRWLFYGNRNFSIFCEILDKFRLKQNWSFLVMNIFLLICETLKLHKISYFTFSRDS